MISIWIFIFFLYLVGLLVSSVLLCYSRSHKDMTWLDEVFIGLLSAIWPTLLLAFMIARLGRFLSIRVIDPLLLKITGEK